MGVRQDNCVQMTEIRRGFDGSQIGQSVIAAHAYSTINQNAIAPDFNYRATRANFIAATKKGYVHAKVLTSSPALKMQGALALIFIKIEIITQDERGNRDVVSGLDLLHCVCVSFFARQL
jgi:hypothetical protein